MKNKLLMLEIHLIKRSLKLLD